MLTIHDETTSGQKTTSFNLDCLVEWMNVRELILTDVAGEAIEKILV